MRVYLAEAVGEGGRDSCGQPSMADKKDTAEYSSSKAPETRKHAEEKETTRDWRLQPGGANGSPTQQGMAALDREPSA